MKAQSSSIVCLIGLADFKQIKQFINGTISRGALLKNYLKTIFKVRYQQQNKKEVWLLFV